jgi:hypothetical protein
MTRDRTRTWLGRQIVGALTALNDQYRFSLFMEYEFIQQLQTLDATLANRFTTDVFKSNKHAARIRVRLGDLETFRNAHRSVGFGAYFATSYEIASSFTDNALEVLRTSSRVPLALPIRSRLGPEEFYWRSLNGWGYSVPAIELIKTLRFMRYRRNALVHLGSTPTPAYANLATSAGSALNGFWRGALVHIDFAIPATGPLTETETVDLLKLMRIVIQRLDTHFVSVIDRLGLIRTHAIQLFGHERVRMNRYIATKRAKKLQQDMVLKYGLSPPESDLRAAVQAVGTR